MDFDTIVDYIDEKFHNITASTWTCQLLFMAKTQVIESIEMDILQFTAATKYKQTKNRNADSYKVYLHPEKYTSSGGFESTSFKELTKELSKKSIQKGFNIVHNGKHVWKITGKMRIRFVCTRYRKFRGEPRSIDNPEYNFCSHNFHNDNQHSRGKARINSVRKTWTKQSFDIKHTCPFYFYVAFDEDVFLWFQV